MLSVLVLLTCACAASSAFVAPEQRNIKPTDVAVWRNTVKLNASYLDGLSGGDKAPPPKQATYSPFKKNPSKPVSDHLQPYFNEAKDAAAEAIGHALEAKAALEEAEESLRAVRPSTEDETVSSEAVGTLYEPPAVVAPQPAAIAPPQPAAIAPPPPAAFAPPQPVEIVTPEPATIAPTENTEIVPLQPEIAPTQPAETTSISFGPALMRPNGSMEDCPTLVKPGLARSPRERDYLAAVDGPTNLNFRDSFSAFPRGHATSGKGSFDYDSLSFRK